MLITRLYIASYIALAALTHGIVLLGGGAWAGVLIVARWLGERVRY